MSGQKVRHIVKLRTICDRSQNHLFSQKLYYEYFRYNRTKIRWSKNSNFLDKAKNVKISKKGALRILDVTYRDTGIYACHAGLSVSELKLKVKPKPGDREPTEEDYEISEEKIDDGEYENKLKSTTTTIDNSL